MNKRFREFSAWSFHRISHDTFVLTKRNTNGKKKNHLGRHTFISFFFFNFSPYKLHCFSDMITSD